MTNNILSIFSIALVLIAISFALLTPAHSQVYFAAPSNSCEITQACEKSGGSCNGTFGDLLCNSSSANSTCCGLGLYCINSTCATDAIGDWCTNDAYCIANGGGQFAICQNNSCVQQSLPGDSCSTNSDCFFKSSTCNNDSICSGLAVNATCKNANDYSCAPGLYCDNLKGGFTCQVQLPENATCGPNDVCAGGNVCSAGKKCIAPFQGNNGTQCASSNECTTSLVCSNKVCVTPNIFEKVSCEGTNSTDCANDSLCRCDTFTGDQICVPRDVVVNLVFTPTTYCGEDNSDLLSCLGTNNCSQYYDLSNFNAAVLNPNSCAAENCKSDFKKAMSCGCDSAQDVYGKCVTSSFCGGFPLWAIIVIAIVAVILVLVIIVVIVMVMRKRRTTYDTIA